MGLCSTMKNIAYLFRLPNLVPTVPGEYQTGMILIEKTLDIKLFLEKIMSRSLAQIELLPTAI